MKSKSDKAKDLELTSTPKGVRRKAKSAAGQSENKGSKKSKVTVPQTPSPEFHIFLQSLQRAKNLLKIHSEAHGKQAKPEKYLSDVHRAAVVMAISALDAFISRFVTNRISFLLSDESEDLPKPLLNKIREATEKSKSSLIIDAVKKNNIRQLIEEILHEEYEKKTFQGTKSIEACLNIVGFESIFNTIASKAKMHEGDLKKDLNEYTRRRHIIVHRGDFDTTENPPKTENKITKTYADKCIKLIEKIGKQISALK